MSAYDSAPDSLRLLQAAPLTPKYRETSELVLV